jgi:hypothetical protein
VTKREILEQLNAIRSDLDDPSSAGGDFQVTDTSRRLKGLVDALERDVTKDPFEGASAPPKHEPMTDEQRAVLRRFSGASLADLEARVAELERLVLSMQRDRVRACGADKSSQDALSLSWVLRREGWSEEELAGILNGEEARGEARAYEQAYVLTKDALARVSAERDKWKAEVLRLNSERQVLMAELESLAEAKGGRLVPHPNGDGTSSPRIVYPGGVGSPKEPA